MTLIRIIQLESNYLLFWSPSFSTLQFVMDILIILFFEKGIQENVLVSTKHGSVVMGCAHRALRPEGACLSVGLGLVVLRFSLEKEKYI